MLHFASADPSRRRARAPVLARRLGAFDVAAATIVGYLALYGAWMVFRWGGPELELAINDLAFIPLGFITVALALAARARAGSAASQRAWLIFALAFAAFWLGDVDWFYVEVVVGEEVPFPSIADAGYLGFYPLVLLGLLSLKHERAVSRLQASLDLAIVIISSGAIIWFMVLAPVAAASADDPLAFAVSLAYPLGDAVVLFALAAALLRRLSDTSRAALALLGIGLLLNIAGDLHYARVALEETYESGGWLDFVWMAGWSAMALAALAQARSSPRSPATDEAPPQARPVSLLPYATVVMLFAFLVVGTATKSMDVEVVVIGAVLTTGLVLVRQVLMTRESARLLEGQASRFRALIHNASDAIAVTDRAGTVKYATPSVERILGIRPESLVGQPLRSILEEEEGSAATSFLVSAASLLDLSGPVEWRLPASAAGARVVEVTAANRLDDPLLEGLVITIRDVTERKAFEQQLEHQAFHDPLTGLANRALLADRVEHALSRARRQPTRPAVICLDLDDFKRINDSQGHAVGDIVLLEVARRIRETIREGDTAARLGGDEFAVLVEDTAAVEEVEHLARRIRDELARPIEIERGAVTVSASIGIVRAESRGVSMIELLRDADIAMYEAKRETHGSWRVFEPAMFSETVERVRFEDDLRQALANQELALAFQPQVDLATNQLVGVEALLRWHHPLRGTVMPLQFIPVAERTGEIVPIGLWVLDEACRIVAAWNTRLEVPIRASVNVSARQLGLTFVDDVARILARTGLPAELLVLELTESVVAKNRPEMRLILGGLRDLGVRISIDDFGTGYSSLSYLSELPVDEVKIDRSFIAALVHNESIGVISTIIGLARQLGVPTVAEGIEGNAQAATLRELGCEVGQGFLLGRPMPQQDFGAWLAASRRRSANTAPAGTGSRTT